MTKLFVKIFLLVVLSMSTSFVSGQVGGVKTNLLYWGTGTPNIGYEFGVTPKTTIDIQGGYNFWNLDGSDTNNKKIAHWVIRPEYRYWFCERYMGHFVGAHAFYGKYNIAGRNIPLLLEKNADQHRYKGDIWGAGFSYGYQLMITKHFSMEFTLGVGYARLDHEKFDCARCGEKLENQTRNYFGPTRAGVSLIYVINK